MFELVLTNNMTCFSVTLLHLYIQCSFPFIYNDMAFIYNDMAFIYNDIYL